MNINEYELKKNRKLKIQFFKNSTQGFNFILRSDWNIHD